MANTLTDLIPDLYKALDVVSRELVGFIPAVTIDADVSRAAKGQDVLSHVVPANSAGFDITPAMAIPAAADQTIGKTKVTINKSRGYPFSWNGVEQRGLNTGAGYASIRSNQMAQAMRALVNEMESDLAALHAKTSRAYGTATTTPFATAGDFTDASEVLRILKDNGSPQSDNQLVINTAAGAKMIGKQAAANLQGSDSILRQGILLETAGLAIRESAQVKTFTAGTVTLGTVTGVEAVGATALGVTTGATTGSIILTAGDIITIAGDGNKYVVAEAVTIGAGTTGTVTIAAPGLRKATAGSDVITIVATSARNMAFARSAIVLATRLPERPEEGDMATDVMTITDDRSGLAFEVAIYPGQRMVRYEISAAWGVAMVKPEHSAILLG